MNQELGNQERKEREPSLGEIAQDLFGVISIRVAAFDYIKKNEDALKETASASLERAMRHPDKLKEIAVGTGLGMVNNFLDVRRKHIEEKSRINQGVVSEFRRFKNKVEQNQTAKQEENGTAQEAEDAFQELNTKLGNIAEALFPWMK